MNNQIQNYINYKRDMWDFYVSEPEYKIENIYGNYYKVLNKPNSYKIALYLNNLHNLVQKICHFLKLNIYKFNPQEQIYINCFLDIHPNNYLLSEMKDGTGFNGLNKPMEVNIFPNKYPVGIDGNKYKLRPKWRDVFLTLRKNNNQLKSDKAIIDLLLHEIAHSAANHTTWRPDDHGKDFKMCEDILKYAYVNI